MTEVRFIHEGEWARVGVLAVYPRDDGTFSIGRPDMAPSFRDLADQTGFANMQAAIDQAVWLVDEAPDILRAVWS